MLLHQHASVRLVDQPHRLGGQPFKLYIVTPKISEALPDQKLHVLTEKKANVWIMRKIIQRTAPIAPRTFYNYQLSIIPTKGAKPATTTCATTALHKNDQLLVMFQLPKNEEMSTEPLVDEVAYDRVADIYHFGPIQVTTFNTQTISVKTSK